MKLKYLIFELNLFTLKVRAEKMYQWGYELQELVNEC